MTTPLFDGIRKYADKGVSSFHTPGHSANAPFINKIMTAELDLTELSETASLYDGGDIIEQSEKNMADIFGAKKSLYSGGGCTLCIQTMLRLCAKNGGKIIAGRTIHKSAVNAMALLGLEPVWIYPEQNAGEGFNGRITASAVEKALIDNSDVCAVYITTPDYFGVISPVHEIAQVTRKYSVPFLVDNAHGSHLIYFDKHPITRGADMSACSLHKTLPVLTGGAVLNIGNSDYINFSKQAMADFGSTSPSFLTLASLDLCTEWMKSEGEAEFSRLELVNEVMTNMALKRGALAAEGECDPVRLCIDTSPLGLDGNAAYRYFRDRMVEPEMHDGTKTVFILTPFNTERDFERLFTAIEDLEQVGAPILHENRLFRPAVAMSLREAFMAQKITLPIMQAVGKVAAQSVCSCPPGIPPVMAGEVVDMDTALLLKDYGFDYLNVVK
ncbi:MAG: aminotransferase class V-fold PLP-dependent enzyme [Clostridia bacterium]|nr:aminotransferase class V-fold PLP-dependent enzyme [Clostridia bacterium]